MTTNIMSDHWRGQRAAPINPAEIRFIAVESFSPVCEGCIFRGQASPSCFVAADISVLAGGPDCDDTAPSGARYVYQLDLSDARQMQLVEV